MLKDLLNELKTGQSALAFTRGVGNGALMGLHKYPIAAMMYGADKVIGEGKGTFADALDVLNVQQQEDRRNNPIASYGGDLVGSLVPAAKGGRAIAGISRLAGPRAATLSAATVGAGQGAISGFNENQDLGEAAMGAAVGAPLAVLGQGGQAAVNAVTKKGAMFVAREREQSALQAASQARAVVKELEGLKKRTPTEEALFESAKKQMHSFNNSATNARKTIRTLDDEKLTPALALHNAATGRTLLRNVLDNSFGARSQGFNTPMMSLGALSGAGIGYAFGSPELGALLGAGGGGLIPKLKIAALAKVPQSALPGAGLYANQVGRNAYSLGNSSVQQAGSETPDEFGQWLDKPEKDEFEQFQDK